MSYGGAGYSAHPYAASGAAPSPGRPKPWLPGTTVVPGGERWLVEGEQPPVVLAPIQVEPATATADGPALSLPSLSPPPASATGDGQPPLVVSVTPPASATADASGAVFSAIPPASATAGGGHLQVLANQERNKATAAVYLDAQVAPTPGVASSDGLVYVDAAVAVFVPVSDDADAHDGVAYVEATVAPLTVEVRTGQGVAYVEVDVESVAKPLYAQVEPSIDLTGQLEALPDLPPLTGTLELDVVLDGELVVLDTAVTLPLYGTIEPDTIFNPAYTYGKRADDDGVNLYGEIHVDVIFTGPNWVNIYDVGYGIGGAYPGWGYGTGTGIGTGTGTGYYYPGGYWWVGGVRPGYSYFPGIPTMGRVQMIRRPIGKVVFDW